MRINPLEVIVFLMVTTLAVGQSGQSELFEYRAYSQGGNSSFVGADTSGMNSHEKEILDERSRYNVASHNGQQGLLEYETTGLGGSSSFVSVDLNGFDDFEKEVVLAEGRGHSLNEASHEILYIERASRMNTGFEEPEIHATGQPGYREYYYTQKNCNYPGEGEF